MERSVIDVRADTLGNVEAKPSRFRTLSEMFLLVADVMLGA